jgi:hypothetical protein
MPDQKISPPLPGARNFPQPGRTKLEPNHRPGAPPVYRPQPVSNTQRPGGVLPTHQQWMAHLGIAQGRHLAGPATLQFKRAAGVLQRAQGVAGGSDATLTGHYNNLIAVPAFQELNTIVTTNQALTLNNSAGGGGGVSYLPAAHSINVPVGGAGGAGQERGYLVFEMHNARKKGAFGRSQTAAPAALAPGASLQQKAVHAVKMALYALAIEWDEWVNVAEFHQRCVLINNQLGAGYVTDYLGAGYANPGAGWYLFKNYLGDQIATGHTGGYDPAANIVAGGVVGKNWVGHKVLLSLSTSFKNSLTITDTELTSWGNGKRASHVKQSNPFINKNETTIAKLAGY